MNRNDKTANKYQKMQLLTIPFSKNTVCYTHTQQNQMKTIISKFSRCAKPSYSRFLKALEGSVRFVE